MVDQDFGSCVEDHVEEQLVCADSREAEKLRELKRNLGTTIDLELYLSRIPKVEEDDIEGSSDEWSEESPHLVADKDDRVVDSHILEEVLEFFEHDRGLNCGGEESDGCKSHEHLIVNHSLPMDFFKIINYTKMQTAKLKWV